MKPVFKFFIVNIIEWQARLVLLRYRPKVIAVTGSVGKTSTKDAIYTALAGHVFVRKSEKSFNSEVGVPLTILGCPNGWSNPFVWFRTIVIGFFLIVFPHKYPKVLVLEVGADKPGDIKRISSWLSSDVVVITRIPDVPVHVEFFPTPEALLHEKFYLVRSLKKNGTLVLNTDDSRIEALKDKVKNKIITYGEKESADFRLLSADIVTSTQGHFHKPVGISAVVAHGIEKTRFEIHGVVGRHHAYPVVVASAVASLFGISTESIVESFKKHQTPRGRMKIIEGIKNTTIIDDTYNSSPVAVEEALKTFGEIVSPSRRLAVLGDMLELGSFSGQEHKKIGALSHKYATILVTVGLRARGIADGALNAGMSESSILQFDKSREAGKYLQNILQDGDIVLVKGSQSMRMEKVVEEIMLHPEKKEDLLVRQDKAWTVR